MDVRPKLDKEITPNDFKDFYWLKEELVSFCRGIGINSSGGKIDIAKRIIRYLESGEIIRTAGIGKSKLLKASSPITINTILGIEHRGYIEKKKFMISVVGSNFHFTTHLLEYFKLNTGKKTYKDLIAEWYKEQELNKDPNYKREIAPQFEYNRYIRDFMNDNPGKTRSEAIEYWKIKKSLRGNNVYRRSDLERSKEFFN